jgi:decaprenylphospho-beta-D-ribofuranose 2-oxidase
MLEKKIFTSFDGGFSAKNEYRRPDRYRTIESDLGQRFRTARGGGYSYVAASFGAPGAVVLEMQHFNRVLRFVPVDRIVEVEAGISIYDLLKLTARQGLYLPVQPGYPAITVGGCIAANVHGKNPRKQGTFFNSVLDLTIFHPNHGLLRIDRSNDPLLLEMTCGGYGLTGIILSATLKLQPLPGKLLSAKRIRVGSMIDGLKVIRELADEGAYAYTWHDIAPASRTFGRGFVFHGAYVPDDDHALYDIPSYNQLTAQSRGKLGLSVWGGHFTRLLNSGYYMLQLAKSYTEEQHLFDSLFPFARKTNYFGSFGYFHLYGKRGLAEYQVLVDDGQAEMFLSEIKRLILAAGVSSVLISMKLFRGTQQWLRFERNGVCITLNFARTPQVLRFFDRLDELTVAIGAIPNLIKDSRLPLNVVRKCYSEYEVFRDNLHRYDPRRLFRSELSERLDI